MYHRYYKQTDRQINEKNTIDRANYDKCHNIRNNFFKAIFLKKLFTKKSFFHFVICDGYDYFMLA